MVHRSKILGTSDAHAAPSGSNVKIDLEVPGEHQIQKNDDDLAPIPVDLADEVEGMYRLMDLISESGSNGYGKEHFKFSGGLPHWFPNADWWHS